MELLDREIQRNLLLAMAETYPESKRVEGLQAVAPGNSLRVNISYLAEHGLVRTDSYDTLSGPILLGGKITAKGMDFLADDGGLGAILGVLTVRLHGDTVRDLLIQRVSESSEPAGVKEKLIDQLKKLPAQSVGQLAEKALNAGIRAIPDVARWLQSIQWA